MESCTEAMVHEPPRAPLGQFWTPVSREDRATTGRYLDAIRALKEAISEIENSDARCVHEAVANLRVCANLVQTIGQILRYNFLLETRSAAEELRKVCDVHLHHGSHITKEGRDAIDDAKTKTVDCFNCALQKIAKDLPVSDEDCELMRQYLVDISEIEIAIVALFRGDAHEAGKGAARCSQHIETLRWKVLQDTNTALNELRKLCDEHAEDNILSEGDHNAIDSAKAKAIRCFSETLDKIGNHSCFADALAKIDDEGEVH